VRDLSDLERKTKGKGEASMTSEYKCAVCAETFVAPHFKEVRLATERTVMHYGCPARWLRNFPEGRGNENE